MKNIEKSWKNKKKQIFDFFIIDRILFLAWSQDPETSPEDAQGGPNYP